MPHILVIDVGTSSSKLALFDETGGVVTTLTSQYAVDYPRPDWAEQNPEDWWRAVCALAPVIMKTGGDVPLAAVVISGQTPLCAPVDERGRPLRPAILWLDRRAAPQVEWLRSHVGEERSIRASANRLDSYFGGPKWLWYRQEEPDLYARTWKILQAGSFVTLRLTGRAVIDPSQAGLCSPCYNADTAAWDADICHEMGIDPALLPEILPSSAVVGEISAAAAAATGLPAGTPVVCGGGDFALACLGAGVVAAPNAALMLGTAGNLLFPGAQNSDPRLLHTRHVTGQPLPFGGVMAGGNMTWYSRILGGLDFHIVEDLDREAEQVPAGSEGLVYLPYLMGERTPIWDPAARGALIGLSSRHTRAHLHRAMLEGVAFAFRQIREIAAAPTELAVAIDGGARSAIWRRIIASVLRIPVGVGGRAQGAYGGGTATGAAFLGAMAAGLVTSYDQIREWVQVAGVIEPETIAASRYDEYYAVYAGLYPRLKGDFETLSRL